jgi:hypothetical protein
VSQSKRVEVSLRSVVAIIALATLPFIAALFAPLFADDYIHIERARALASGQFDILLDGWVLVAEDAAAWWAPSDLAIPYFRPLVTLSFLLDDSFFGLAASGYHLTNLVLHVLVTLLVLRIASHLLAPAQAWAAAALFAVHPCHAEAVVWASGRTDVLMAACYAFAVWADMERGVRRTRGWLGLSVAFALAGLLAKEMAITLPVILALHAWLFRRGQPAWWWGAAASGTVAAVYLLGRTLLLGPPTTPPHPFGHGLGDPDFAWNVVGGSLLYLVDLLLIAPVDPAEGFPLLSRHWPVLLGLAALAGAILAWITRRALARPEAERGPARVALFALAWLAITILPVLPISVGERFLYLPSVGLCLLVGAAVPPQWSAGPFKARRYAVALLLALALVTAGKVVVWKAFSEVSRGAIDQTLAALDAHPDAILVAVVDLPGTSALGFPHAVRLARPERELDVAIVSVAPHFITPVETFRSSVDYRGDRISIRAAGSPYLQSYIERAFRGEAAPYRGGEHVRWTHFDVVIGETSQDGVLSFDVELPPARSVPRLVLRGSGFTVEALTPDAGTAGS